MWCSIGHFFACLGACLGLGGRDANPRIPLIGSSSSLGSEVAGHKHMSGSSRDSSEEEESEGRGNRNQGRRRRRRRRKKKTRVEPRHDSLATSASGDDISSGSESLRSSCGWVSEVGDIDSDDDEAHHSSTCADEMLRRRLPPRRYGEKYTALSIDGGGIRGLIPAVILDKLEKELQDLEEQDNPGRGNHARIADYFDVIVGTSTGGLIAALLAVSDEEKRPKYTAEQIIDFYKEEGPKIFKRKGLLGLLPNNIRMLMGPRYDGTILHDTIKKYIVEPPGRRTVSTKIMLPAFDVYNQQTKFFVASPHGPRGTLADMCIATSAAPTYFPAHYFERKLTRMDGVEEVKMKNNVIDGGLGFNNPDLYVAMKIGLLGHKNSPDQNPTDNYRNCLLLSIGTGESMHARYRAEECARWGIFGWLSKRGNNPLIEMIVNANALVHHFTTAFLFQIHRCQDNYFRIQAKDFDTEQSGRKMIPLDDASEESMMRLVEIAEKLLQDRVSRVCFEKREWISAPSSNSERKTNQEELRHFAKMLYRERKQRLEKRKNARAAQPSTSSHSAAETEIATTDDDDDDMSESQLTSY